VVRLTRLVCTISYSSREYCKNDSNGTDESVRFIVSEIQPVKRKAAKSSMGNILRVDFESDFFMLFAMLSMY